MNEELKSVLDRARSDLSMVDFANKCGISYSTLYRWLRGQQKTTMHPQIIQKIYKNAAPNSGLTEADIYNASLQSIEGKGGERYTRELRIRAAEETMINCARKMCFSITSSPQELPKKELGVDYGMRINNGRFLFDLHVSPEGPGRHGLSNAWWLRAIKTTVGDLYMTDPKYLDACWLHVVIAVNDEKEAKLLHEVLTHPHYRSELPMSFVILDLDQESFVGEYEVGADKQNFLEKTAK